MIQPILLAHLKNIHIYIADYSVISVNKINVLCVGSATSIDRMYRRKAEQRTGKKTYWGAAELPYYDSEKLNIINNQQFANAIHLVASHTAPSFAYPTSKENIATWIAADEGLNQLLDKERAIIDQLFANLQKWQPNITDWYYGHFHEHKLEQHYGINFHLCDCGEINEFRKVSRKQINEIKP